MTAETEDEAWLQRQAYSSAREMASTPRHLLSTPELQDAAMCLLSGVEVPDGWVPEDAARSPRTMPLDVVLATCAPVEDIAWADYFDWLWSADHAEMDALTDRVARTGVTAPILLGDDCKVLDGGRRLAAAYALGMSEVPVETRAERQAREQASSVE